MTSKEKPAVIVNDGRRKPPFGESTFDGEFVSAPLTQDDLPEILNSSVKDNFSYIQNQLGSMGIEIPADWSGREMLGLLAHWSVNALNLKRGLDPISEPGITTLFFPEDQTTISQPNEVSFRVEFAEAKYEGTINVANPNNLIIGMPRVAFMTSKGAVSHIYTDDVFYNMELTTLGREAIQAASNLYFSGQAVFA